MAKLAFHHHRAEGVEDDAARQLGRIVVDVVGRRDLDDLHAAEALSCDEADDFERFARQQATGLWRTGSRREAGIDGVDVERQIDGLAAFPGEVRKQRWRWDRCW